MANLRTNNLSGEQGQNAYRGSVFFDGGGQLDVTSNSDFAVGTGAYTAELWFYSGLNSGENSLFGTFTASNFGFGMWHNANNLYFEERQNAFSGDNPRIIYDTFEEGHWYHLAMCRDSSSGTLRAYVNGVQIGSTTSNLRTIAGTAPTIGENGAASNQCKGYISNIRFSNTELYPSGTTFTPPTSELTADASTILLACQNSNNHTQEETGKTITADGSLVQTASELTAGELTSSNYSSAASDWSFSGGTATVSMSSNGYASLGSVPGRLVNGQLYELVVNVTTFNAGKITFGQANAGNADFTIALGRNVIRHVYAGSTQDSGGIAIYARDATGGGYATNLISLKQVIRGEQPKVIPPFGVDAGNTFGGTIQQNSQGYMYFPTGRTEERGRGRGIIAGGYNGPSSFSYNAALSEVEIASDGVTSKFGDLTQARYTVATVGSSTRSVFIGGGADVSPNPFFTVNTMDFVTIATKGNAQDFGDSDEVGYFKTGVSSSTRGVYTQGRIYNPSAGTGSNALEFITIASTGNGQDFGDLVGGGRVSLTNTAMSPTRGILAGGVASPVGDPTTFVNTIEFVTMASLGNSVNFGDLQKSGGRSNGNCSSSTRGVFSITTQSSADGNTLEFVTIATTGDAIDFGDLTGGQNMRGACCNKTRGLFAGGFVAPGSANYVNVCEKITIATTGSASDWGDVFEGSNRAYNSGISDCHGGLS